MQTDQIPQGLLCSIRRRLATSFCVFGIGLAVLLILPVSLQAQATMPAQRPLELGAAWYPEQWPESRWNADLQLMEDAHLHVVRVGEFAWSRMEPSDGHYDLDWLEHAVRLAEKHHIAVVLGTPTDAPPAWLTSAHPETLRVEANGHRVEHGNRRQFNTADPYYREECAKIVEQMAHRFGHDPNVIGWQIGNEFSEDSYDGETKHQFHLWLQRKFGTLDALNKAWTTDYWSQTYDRWDEIPLPSGGGNPGLLLAHRQFVTDMWVSFEEVQINVLRRLIDPRQFITTNIGGLGWTDKFDHYTLTRPLDLAAWDDYVGEGHLNVDRNAAMHDFVRGWKRQNFWVMETEPGFVNWAPVNNILNRGETRAMAWQAVGHGADAVLYWQWRSALNGQEQYHGTIVGPDGEPVPIYSEIQQIGKEFEQAGPALAGTKPVAQVAILHSYDSRWAIDFQLHNHNYNQQEILLDYYRPLREANLTVDIIEPTAPLNSYRLILAPDLNVITPKLAQLLEEYVRQGGHLLLGPRSGMKNEFDALNTQRQPGPLVPFLGGRVEQYYALENPVPVSGSLASGTASLWAEQLSVRNSEDEILLRYGKSNGWLDDQPAMITRRYGQGRITYLGAVLDENSMRKVMQWAMQDAHLSPEFGPLPNGVELCRRVGSKHTVYIFIQHGPDKVRIELPLAMRDVLHEGASVHSIELAPQGVAVLEKDSQAQ